jgi:hypothetical protein
LVSEKLMESSREVGAERAPESFPAPAAKEENCF